jgi:hypothetical protein
MNVSAAYHFYRVCCVSQGWDDPDSKVAELYILAQHDLKLLRNTTPCCTALC